MSGVAKGTIGNHLALTLVALLSLSVSLLAILLHAAGWLPMYFVIDLLGMPSLLMLLTLGVIAYNINEQIFLDRLVVGAWAGLMGTFAYDLIRYAIWQAGLVHFNPFLSHPMFGRMISGYAETTAAATVVGWAYHFWNGFSLGTIYALIAGRAHWYHALAWALFLEIAWLATLPSVLQLKVTPAFVVLGFVGHGAYGVVLGMLSQRFISA